MDTESIGKMLGGVISSGGVGSITSAIDSGLKLILKLTEEDPVKRQKALREYYMGLYNVAKEVRGSEDGKDVSDLATALIQLLDDK